MPAAAAAAPTAPPPQRARIAARGLRSAVAGAAIGLALYGFMGHSLVPVLVQSICTSVCCWFAIDLGRIPLARWSHRHDPPGSAATRSHWPGWPLMMVAVVIGTVFGFSVGGTLADMVLGRTVALGYFRGGWTTLPTLLLASLVPGTAITYWFYSRELIAVQEAAVQAAERQAAEHQLKLLESQLEPHMLFNTLANLRVLIALDPPRAQAMLDQLIAFLRATLAGSRAAQHPVRAEFARLADYLALMQVRMGERLQARFDLPESLAELPVPPLLLQPLVENAIRHGLEPALDGGRIEVSAARDGDQLLLRVRDTGVGLTGDATDGTRFGLTQVRDRLRALYGAGAASLALAPAEDGAGGTVASIRLPIRADTTVDTRP